VKRLYLYDDAKAREFEPFALTRPVSELRAGAELIRLRWERVAGTKAYGFIGAPHLIWFDELDAPPAVQNESTIPAGSVVVNSRCVVSLDGILDETSAAFACDERLCAVRVRKSIDMRSLADGSASLEDLVEPDVTATVISGRWLDEVWDLIGDLGAQLSDDIPIMGGLLSGAVIEKAMIIGKHPIYCETGVGIEPFVVFDANDGPILIRRGATIASFSRIVGPCYIGEDSQIIGDAIRACSIGDVCKVRGEISQTVMLGHSNKGHTGFVGSSYIGRWVNIGAGTTTSNLKNTYGSVQLWTPTGTRNTGLQFLGSLIGDHAKTGIGSMLTTGCVIGAGANIYGSEASPKYIPPFAWGNAEPYDRFESDKFVEVAERMMARRHVTLGVKARRHLLAACESSGAQTK
jgi:UDP-N-acetylglucosamine diphosphorylase / glucose-1-phosphate thymidylyltransferase / UDP-N-acetylgalactosamine diphosphorylase / glucosamine-1-phosphate N-acetyltransferase / galactosamine-1-phosphate N-acetyltransferase